VHFLRTRKGRAPIAVQPVDLEPFALESCPTAAWALAGREGRLADLALADDVSAAAAGRRFAAPSLAQPEWDCARNLHHAFRREETAGAPFGILVGPGTRRSTRHANCSPTPFELRRSLLHRMAVREVASPGVATSVADAKALASTRVDDPLSAAGRLPAKPNRKRFRQRREGNTMRPRFSEMSAPLGRALFVVSHSASTYALGQKHLAALRLSATVHIGACPSEPPADDYGLVALDLSPDPAAAVHFGARLLRKDPASALFFFCEDSASPELAAILTLGITPILVGPDGRDWLVQAAPALVRLASLRRVLKKAEANVPAIPANATNATRAKRPPPLPIAEERFRETYLRALVATVGNRADAAVLAGISYRSACRILRDVGLAPEPTATARSRSIAPEVPLSRGRHRGRGLAGG
jgi:hypothetical protein